MERRRNPRVLAYRPVRLQVPRSFRIVETLTKDLSSGGMRCISTEPYPVTTELTLEVMLASGQQPISLKGKLAWFSTIPHSDQFNLGITFVDVPAQDKRRLSAYLDRLAQQAPLVAS